MMDLDELAQKDILKYEDLVHVRRALENKTPILVTGMTGSGKTTFVKALVKDLEDKHVLIFAMMNGAEYIHDLDPKRITVIDTERVLNYFGVALRFKTDYVVVDELRDPDFDHFVAASQHAGLIVTLHGTEERVKQLLPEEVEEVLVIEVANTNDRHRYIKSVNLLKK